MLLALGAFAYEALWRLPEVERGSGEKRARFAHGLEVPLRRLSCHRRAAAHACSCSYHPSQRNVFTGLLTAEMFDERARARPRARGLTL